MNDASANETEKPVQRAREQASMRMRGEDSPHSALMGLAMIIIVAYLLTTFPGFNRPHPQAVIWGAWFTPAVNAGELWRLLTPALLHANITHVLSNLFGLWVFGRQIEPLLGPRNMVGLFAAGLLFSDLAMYAADMVRAASEPGYLWAPSIGASGIVAGVISANVTFVVLIRRRTHPEAFGRDLLGVMLLLMVYVFMDIMATNVNLWAHLGGYAGGLLFALAYHGMLMAKARRLAPGEVLDTRL